MNAQNYFAVADKALPQTLVPGFFIVWIAFALGSKFFITTRQSPRLKKLWHDRFSVVAGVIWFAFIATIIIPHRVFLPLFIFGPACVLISWLQIRNTYYCDKCGKCSLNPDWFGQAAYHCPKCGNKLK